MRFVIRAAAAALCVFVVSGCVTRPAHWGPQKDLPRPLATEMTVEVRVPSEEIAVHVMPGNAAMYGGGLLGVLIQTSVDSARARGAEGRVAQIRDAMAGNDYREISRQLVEQHLDRSLVAPVLDLELLTASLEQQRLDATLGSRRNVMVLEHDYYFEAAFGHIQVELVARIGDRVVDGRRMNEENMRYYNRFYYTVPLPEAETVRGRDDRAEAWYAMGAEAIDAIVREGMRETIAMLNHDLAGGQGEAEGPRVRYVNRANSGFGTTMTRNGRADRVWVRERSAPFLHSVPAP
ncbi:MAG: hypothetical protein ACXIUZ_12225 [Lysobacteraceae bacterium]